MQLDLFDSMRISLRPHLQSPLWIIHTLSGKKLFQDHGMHEPWAFPFRVGGFGSATMLPQVKQADLAALRLLTAAPAPARADDACTDKTKGKKNRLLLLIWQELWACSANINEPAFPPAWSSTGVTLSQPLCKKGRIIHQACRPLPKSFYPSRKSQPRQINLAHQPSARRTKGGPVGPYDASPWKLVGAAIQEHLDLLVPW